VEVTIAVMKAVAVMVAMMGNAENAIHRADGPADTCSDRTADDGADRAGRTATLSRAPLGTADDTLGVRDRRDRGQGKGKCRGRKIDPLARADRQRQCSDIRVHLDFLCDNGMLDSTCFTAFQPYLGNADVT
jgi:hypothetical protein